MLGLAGIASYLQHSARADALPYLPTTRRETLTPLSVDAPDRKRSSLKLCGRRF
jgi:hypothetical protein